MLCSNSQVKHGDAYKRGTRIQAHSGAFRCESAVKTPTSCCWGTVDKDQCTAPTFQWEFSFSPSHTSLRVKSRP